MSEKCKVCDGGCCKNNSGMFSPDQIFTKGTIEELHEFSKRFAIAARHYDSCGGNFAIVPVGVFSAERRIFDNPCVYFKSGHGCTSAIKPFECEAYEAGDGETFKCRPAFDLDELVLLWEPYQDIVRFWWLDEEWRKTG